MFAGSLRRRVIPAVVTAVAVVLVLFYRLAEPVRFATPAACVEAFGTAGKQGDARGYLDCLAEPLRSETGQRYGGSERLAEALRQSMAEVKGWVQIAPLVEGSVAQVDVDEVRRDGIRRIHFRLERSRAGWRVAAIGARRERAAPVPYGTHIKEVVEAP